MKNFEDYKNKLLFLLTLLTILAFTINSNAQTIEDVSSCSRRTIKKIKKRFFSKKNL